MRVGKNIPQPMHILSYRLVRIFLHKLTIHLKIPFLHRTCDVQKCSRNILLQNEKGRRLAKQFFLYKKIKIREAP